MFETKPLRLLAKVTMGQAPVGETYNTEGLGLPLLAGAGDFDEGRPNAKKFTTAPSKTCSVGDIVIGIRASIGDQVVADGNYCLGRGVAGIRARDGVDQRFLLRCLEWRRPFLESKAKGATFKQVNREDVESLLLPLPPLSEQRRIADILDKADALRAKRRAALALLDTLTQSIFLDMFGNPATNPKRWPLVTVGDLVESTTYGTSAKASATGRFAVLRMNNITSTGLMDLSDIKFMDLPTAEMPRYTVRRGDVLFNRTNSPALVGKTAIYRDDQIMAYAGYLIRLRLNEANDPEYLAAFMNTPYTKRVLKGMCKSIIGMANINAKELRAIKIAQPPLDLQQRFAAAVGETIELRRRAVESLNHLDALFASLMHRAFRGEL